MEKPKLVVNKKLLPMKGHYFFFNAGTAPLVPYLSTYARQLGFSSSTVGLIYTVLPIFGLVAKPLFGVIADRYYVSDETQSVATSVLLVEDAMKYHRQAPTFGGKRAPAGGQIRFKIQKLLFIFFQIVIIVSFSSIYFIPDNRSDISVDLDCGDGATVLRSCFKTANEINNCTLNAISSQSTSSVCKMTCDMTSPKMWQTVCEHWHIPKYCYGNTNRIDFISNIKNVTLKDECVYISSGNVTLDEYVYEPKCRIGSGYVDINEPCILACLDEHLSTLIDLSKANMTCLNNTLNYRLCDYDIQDLANVSKEASLGQCQTSCDLNPNMPWRLMEICEGWGADAAYTCQPRTRAGESFPESLSFDGTIMLSTAQAVGECAYVELNHIKMSDGTVHYPYCVSNVAYQKNMEMFHSSCNINCDNEMVNELFKSASESKSDEVKQYTKQFWLFFILMIISWVGQAVVVTFADAICFNLLGTKASHYGKQRLWGSFGWGIISLLTGILIDLFSDGMYKNYTVAFIMMFVFMCGDVIVSCCLKIESTKMSVNILADVGSLITTIPSVIFILWTIAVGLCTALVWQFLFWHIEDIANLNCDGSQYVKTLQGVVSAIQTFGGEIPFMFISGYILRKFGHANTMTMVLFAFGVRFVLYSIVTNAWWIVPIEIFQGVTYGMFYPTMTSYANFVSPPGTETTVQGLVGAVFEGVGTSLGSYIGGQLYSLYGGWNTFLWFGIGSFIACALHVIAQYTLNGKNPIANLAQGYTSIIRYDRRKENEGIFMLDDISGAR